jgi:hypothetical protein
MVKVHRGGRGDENRINLAIAQELLDRGVNPKLALAGEISARGGDIRDGQRADLIGARQPRGVLGADSAEPDDAYSDGILGHVGNLKTKTPTSVIQH